MSGSFRNILRIGNTSGLEHVENKILSIGLKPDGFVFAILEEKTFRYILLEDYSYPASHSAADLLHELNIFFDANNYLKGPFRQVHISLFTPHLLIIPEDFYHPDHKEMIYGFCAELPQHHKIQIDRLNNLKAYGLYDLPINMESILDSRFDNYRIRHQGTALLEGIIAANQLEQWKVDLVIHVKQTIFEVVLLEKKKVVFYQSFSYKVFDDLLYYLFYVLEQFQRDAALQRLMLIGEIGRDSESFRILESLFYKVYFPDRNDAFQYAEAFDQIPGHYYFNLLNLVSCG